MSLRLPAVGWWQARCDARKARVLRKFFVCEVVTKEPVMATATKRNESGANESGRKQRPVWSKKGFPLTIAVFEFPMEKGPPNFSVKLTRTFKRDENSEWENSEYLGGGDLLRASKLFEYADAFVQSRLQAFYESQKENGDF